MTEDKPLAALVAEVDAAVALMTLGEWCSIFHRLYVWARERERAIILGDYEFDNERDAAGIVALRNAWPRVSAELRILLADDALHRKYRSECEAGNEQMRKDKLEFDPLTPQEQAVIRAMRGINV